MPTIQGIKLENLGPRPVKQTTLLTSGLTAVFSEDVFYIGPVMGPNGMGAANLKASKFANVISALGVTAIGMEEQEDALKVLPVTIWHPIVTTVAVDKSPSDEWAGVAASAHEAPETTNM